VNRPPSLLHWKIRLYSAQCTHKLKYLGCFFNQSCTVDCDKQFKGNFNNMLSALGRNRNEISAVHLVKSYCIPSLLYGCQIWTLSSSDYHKMNVIKNNAFRKIFQCCWRACFMFTLQLQSLYNVLYNWLTNGKYCFLRNSTHVITVL